MVMALLVEELLVAVLAEELLLATVKSVVQTY